MSACNCFYFFFSSRRRHTRFKCDWSSDVCSSDLARLCYCGSVLHTVPAGMTKMREPIQIGAELYGHAGLEADVEIVRLMIAALKKAGVARLHIDLGHPGVYRAMIEGTDGERAAAIF